MTVGVMGRVHLRRSDCEFNDEFGIKLCFPRDDDLCHLAEGWQGLRPDEEVVGQINSDWRTSLVYDNRGIVTSYVEVSETKLENYAARIGRKAMHVFRKVLLPAILSVELHL